MLLDSFPLQRKSTNHYQFMYKQVTMATKNFQKIDQKQKNLVSSPARFKIVWLPNKL